MFGADRVGVGWVDQIHPSSDYGRQVGSRLRESGRNDLKAASGLHPRIIRARPVGEDRRRTRHQHPVSDADGSGETDRGLERRTRSDLLTFGHARL